MEKLGILTKEEIECRKYPVFKLRLSKASEEKFGKKGTCVALLNRNNKTYNCFEKYPLNSTSHPPTMKLYLKVIGKLK